MLNWLRKCIPAPLKRMTKRSVTSAWESLLYRFTRQHVNRCDLKNIVFVCKGNICRSAFAEKYLKRNIFGNMIRIESCGLDVDQGGNSPQVAVQIAKEFGIELDTHRSKGITACNFFDADLIVAMEYQQYRRLMNLVPEKAATICVLRDFAPWPYRLMCNIYDPFGLEEGEFRRCFRRMKRALDGLKNYILIPVGNSE